MTDEMKLAQAREMRQAFKAMKEDELKEAVKEIPSEILIMELAERLNFEESKARGIYAIAKAKR